MAITVPVMKTDTLSTQMQQLYDKVLLKEAIAQLGYQKFATHKQFPKGKSKTIQFRRWDNITASTTPLTEGVVPTAVPLSQEEVIAVLAQYGAWTSISDFNSLTSFDPIFDDAARLLGRNAGEVIDKIVMTAMVATTNKQYSGSATSTATVAADDVLTVDDIRKAVRTLKKLRAPKFNRNGQKHYICICGPDAAYDLQDDSKWEDPHKYVDPKNIYDGELGRLYGVVFVEVTEAYIREGAGASGIDVYSSFVFGEDAYGDVALEGNGAPSIIVKPPTSGGAENPLNQVGSVAWKVNGYAAKVLNDDWIIEIQHAVSA
jgi:N4-gp56 family major capsid protein